MVQGEKIPGVLDSAMVWSGVAMGRAGGLRCHHGIPHQPSCLGPLGCVGRQKGRSGQSEGGAGSQGKKRPILARIFMRLASSEYMKGIHVTGF